MTKGSGSNLTGAKTYQLALEQIRVIFDPSTVGESAEHQLKRTYDDMADSSPLRTTEARPIDFDFSSLIASSSSPSPPKKQRVPLENILERTSPSPFVDEASKTTSPIKPARRGKGKAKGKATAAEPAQEFDLEVPMEE